MYYYARKIQHHYSDMESLPLPLCGCVACTDPLTRISPASTSQATLHYTSCSMPYSYKLAGPGEFSSASTRRNQFVPDFQSLQHRILANNADND